MHTDTYTFEVDVGPHQFNPALSVQSDGLWSIADDGLEAAVGSDLYREWLVDVWDIVKSGRLHVVKYTQMPGVP